MRQQAAYFIVLILIIPLLPLLLWQGWRLKKRLVRLPEAENLKGQVEETTNPLSILIFGESAFAGVGVQYNENGVAGQLANCLAAHLQRSVKWEVIAKSGYNARQATEILAPQVAENQYDIIYIGLGANEAFELNAPLTFRKNLKKCIEVIRKHHPKTPIVLADMPPVGQFIALPFMIRKIMGTLVNLHGNVIADFPQQFDNLFYQNQKITFAAWKEKASKNAVIDDFFCEDGVHPSALTFQLWAEDLGAFTLSSLTTKGNEQKHPHSIL